MLRQQYKHAISCLCTVVGGDRTKQLPVLSHRIPSRYESSRTHLVSPVSPAIGRTEPPLRSRPTQRAVELILWLFDNAFSTENTGFNCRVISKLPNCKGRGRSHVVAFVRGTVSEAARSETWVCGRSLVGDACSNPTGGMEICML
jgi:hypothetical protein